MSDPYLSLPPDESFDPAQFVLGQQRRALTLASTSLDEDPEKAARAQELSDATGVPASLIHTNLEQFEQQHKAVLTSQLLNSNAHLRDYINNNPMAAKVSNDDWGNLDAASEALKKLNLTSVPGVGIIPTTTAAGDVFHAGIEGFKEGAGDSAVGSWTGIDWADPKVVAEHPIASAWASTITGVTDPIEAAMRLFSGATMAVVGAGSEVLKQSGMTETGKATQSLGQALMDPGFWASLGPLGHMIGLPFEAAEFNRKMLKTVQEVKPFTDLGLKPPVGAGEVSNNIISEQAKADIKLLDEAVSAIQSSNTFERSPALAGKFIEEVTRGEVGVTPDAIRALYGDKVPALDDGILGHIPDLANRLAAAEADGSDVRIPLSEYAKTDSTVLNQLKDYVRVREGGVTLDEAKILKDHQKLTEEPEIEGGEPAEPSAVDAIQKAAALRPIVARLTLEPKQVSERLQQLGGHAFHLLDPEGKEVGYFNVAEENGGKSLYIDTVEALAGPGAFGTSAVRDLAKQLFDRFPNAEVITGDHVGGAAQGKISIRRPKPVEIKERPTAAMKQLELPVEGTTRIENRLPFTDPQAVGMTQEQYKLHLKNIDRWREETEEAKKASITEKVRKRQTAEWKDNRSALRPEIAEKIVARPDIAADRELRDGLRLDPRSLTDEQRASIPKAYFSKDGITISELAARHGIDSADGMANLLSSVEAGRKRAGMKPEAYTRRLIDAETDRAMEEKYGKLTENVIREAKDIVLSEVGETVLHERTLGLAEKAGEQYSISKAGIHAQAAEAISEMKVGDVSSDRKLADAGRAGRKMEIALLKDKAVDGFKESAAQTLAAFEAKMLVKVEAQFEKFQKLVDKYQDRQPSGVMAEYVNFIHDILRRVGKSKRTVQDLRQEIGAGVHKSLGAFVQARSDTTHGMLEIPTTDFLLDDSWSKPWKELTVDEARGVMDTVTVLDKLGRMENKIERAGEIADRADVVEGMNDSLRTFPLKEFTLQKPKFEKIVKGAKAFRVGLMNMETWLNRWDRDNIRGWFNQYIVRPMTEASNRKNTFERDFAKRYADLGEIPEAEKLIPSPLIDPLTRTPSNPDGSPYNGFSRKNLAAMISNAGNEYNWRVLTKGHEADPIATMREVVRLSRYDDWVRAEKLGNEIFKPAFEAAQTVYRNVHGMAPEKILLKPFSIVFPPDHPDFGKRFDTDGWYHPILRDDQRTNRIRSANGQELLEGDKKNFAATANGYTKKRTGAIDVLALDHNQVPLKLNQILHDTAYRAEVVEVSKLIRDDDLRRTITQHYGREYVKMLDDYLKEVAGGSSYDTYVWQEFAKASNYFRGNVIGTLIGFNPYTVMKHGPTAAVNSAYEVGVRAFGKAFGDVSGDWLKSTVADLFTKNGAVGETSWDFAMRTSEELQRRQRHWWETVVGEHKVLTDQPTLRETILYQGSRPVAFSDLLSAVPTWLAKYGEEFAESGDHGMAVFAADRAVRRAHGSTAITNLPELVRGGGPFHSWLTSLYGFFGTQMQRRAEIAFMLNDIYKLGKAVELKAAAKNVPKLGGLIFASMIWPTIVEEFVTSIGTSDHRSGLTRLMEAALGGAATSVLYFRDVAYSVVSGKDPSVGLASTPLHDFRNVASDLEKGTKSLDNEHAGKTVEHFLTMFGDVTGKMPKEGAHIARFGIDYAHGVQRPKDAGDVGLGLTKGTMKPRIVK